MHTDQCHHPQGCANCECENGKRANELCFQTIEADVRHINKRNNDTSTNNKYVLLILLIMTVITSCN